MAKSSFRDRFKKSKVDIETLQKKLRESDTSAKQDYSDERFWFPERDAKTGNGSAVIRFLPNEEVPFVKYYQHGFEVNGRWYIENCPTSIGKDCPVCTANSELWNASKNPKDPRKATARDRKRKLNYVSNVYVISDPANPENEGKVFLFRYGKTIYDMIMDKVDPEDEFGDGIEPIDVFDFWEGADFKFRIRRNSDGYADYDKSEFDSPSEFLDGDDKELEKVYKSLYDLGEFIAPNQFKSFEELEKRFDYVVHGVKDGTTYDGSSKPSEDDSDDGSAVEAHTDQDEDLDEELATASAGVIDAEAMFNKIKNENSDD